ncbi:helix-turn-helix transcriptional regulator [Shigella sp. FC1967]|uniref:helix-turn-helix transcriptional regulator n=1 Tax=Shigella sp. FC1967 TaxID=1898041 RepID=UPI000A3E84F8
MSRKNLEYNYPAQRTVGDKILFLIKKHGPMQANEIGQRLGTSGEAARQQFVKLANAGFVEAITEPKGVGRPIQYWHLTELGQKQFPDTHAELTAQILLTIREELGESAIDKIILARKKTEL